MNGSFIYNPAVPRTRPPERFAQLLDAGLEVFGAKGLAHARMADVAEAMGVSPGTLYQLVEGKEALFHWIVERGADPSPVGVPAALPIPTPEPGAGAARLREQLSRAFHLPHLDAALRRRRVRDARAELEGIVRELFERIEATRRPARVLERSALELPELFRLYFRGVRREFLARLEWYVERRMARGHFRAVARPAVAARLLAETVTWFARNRHPDPEADLLPDGDAVREDVVRLLVSTFVPD
jgi:AcrR family transcriptional regulator